MQWESYVSLGVLLVLLILLALQLLLGLLLLQPLLLQVLQPSLLLSEVLLMLCLDQCLRKFINKTLQGGKRLLFNSDPWPPAEQKLEMPCDSNKKGKSPHQQFQLNSTRGRYTRVQIDRLYLTKLQIPRSI